MAHIVAAPCNDCKYTDCCVVCPVECFYQDDMMLYIDPVDCIDCEACVPECPVEAIFAEANTPAQWTSYIQLNAEKAAAWLKKGAQPTDRVLRFLDKAGLKKREARNNPKKALPGKKRQEREKAAADAAAKAAEAAAAPQG